MLDFLPAILAATALAAPPIEVSTLDGNKASGELVSLSSSELVLKADSGEQSFDVESLLEVRFTEATGGGAVDRDRARVALVDGTRLDCSEVTVSRAGAKLVTARVGETLVPFRALSYIRFPGAVEKFDESWSNLAGSAPKDDLIVVRKPAVLDRLKGVIGAIDEKAVRFTLGGNEIPVDRKKLYGVVYGNRSSVSAKTGCAVSLTGADTVTVKSLAWDGDGFSGTLVAGGAVTIPVDRVRLLDFSLGKIRYLSRTEPESVDYVRYWPDDDLFWVKYRRDVNQIGKPIRIGEQRFERGLWVHSGTTLKYRLAGEYRTFAAVMGIERDVRHAGATLHLIVKADGKVLLEKDVTGADAASDLRLDVSGKNFLEIVVEFGKDRDNTADHLALGEARLLK